MPFKLIANMSTKMFRYWYHAYKTRSSAIAATAEISVIVAEWLTLSITLMTCANFTDKSCQYDEFCT